MRLAKRIKFIWSDLIETRPTIAIFEFLKTREPLLSVPFLESNWLLMEFVETATSIQPMYAFFAKLHPHIAKTEL